DDDFLVLIVAITLANDRHVGGLAVPASGAGAGLGIVLCAALRAGDEGLATPDRWLLLGWHVDPLQWLLNDPRAVALYALAGPLASNAIFTAKLSQSTAVGAHPSPLAVHAGD